jgi:poly(hydroxyalkanoate) depolymerase family esterase
MKLNDDFLSKMQQATELLRTSGPAAATEAIQRALQGGSATAGHSGAEAAQTVEAGRPTLVDINAVPGASAKAPEAATREQSPKGYRSLLDRLRGATKFGRRGTQTVEDVDIEAVPDAATKPAANPGKFLSASMSNQAGTRAYKVYVPSGYRGEPVPLVVMLHGCKQNPDDFAAGTGMNRVAEENTCIVLYPEQARKANGSNCWNWFNDIDQKRDRGEPSIIADITRQAMRDYQIDPKRVYVAGLSAGGAMAAIVAAAYPELYAAVGIHSGLPVGSAHDVPSAFGAMQQGSKSSSARAYARPVPAIVFHGDRDTTVHPDNGVGALAQSLHGAATGGQARSPNVSKGTSAKGRAYTQTVHYGGDEAPFAEHWVVHGAGHAWAGGTRAGSYTDPRGPDASREMLRFFLSHPRRNAA